MTSPDLKKDLTLLDDLKSWVILAFFLHHLAVSVNQNLNDACNRLSMPKNLHKSYLCYKERFGIHVFKIWKKAITVFIFLCS